ncbi:MAG: DNA repair ATPase [Pseudomonadales bacterium]|nr:DNA repair ATPase [Pseudomonadales bacterium]
METDAKLDNAVASGNAYDVLKRRLNEQADTLLSSVNDLNARREAEFGASALDIKGRARIRTENNCVARDIIRVGDWMLFGYNVFLGLKTDTKVDDVFTLFQLEETESGFDIHPCDATGTFLDHSEFKTHFSELYKYYKHARLVELKLQNAMLLASFQISDRVTDIKVFRWSLNPDGSVKDYIDNRGERDIAPPPTHDFEWLEADRQQFVEGRHPHLNIDDVLFIDNIQGTITFKIENNTDTGHGIFSEPVEDENQSLDDGEFGYTKVGDLYVVKILPYRENQCRFYIFNPLLEQVIRVDDIGDACRRLPEDHGLIFPNGYYLSTGEFKSFDQAFTDLHFRRMEKSPNGEDVLYVFYEPKEGRVVLYSYNLIRKAIDNPLSGHGYALFPDGCLLLCYAEDEPTRLHPVQIWQTSFMSDEYALTTGSSNSELGRIGNPELVRGIADLRTIYQLACKNQVSTAHFAELIRQLDRLFDHYHWLDNETLGQFEPQLRHLRESVEQILDEYEKVAALQKQSLQALNQASEKVDEIIRNIQPDAWHTPLEFIQSLQQIRLQRGHLTTLQSQRYVDKNRLAELDGRLQAQETRLSELTATFLQKDNALEVYDKKLQSLQEKSSSVTNRKDLKPLLTEFAELAAGLEMVSELVAGLDIDDVVVKTQIIEDLSAWFARINQAKARAENQAKSLGAAEAKAEFAAQFRLLDQAAQSALGQANSPDKCDELLARVMSQLQEIEGQFSDFDEFLADLINKRETLQESFERRRQALFEEQQRRAHNLAEAGKRILQSIEKRSQQIAELDALNAFFASDPLCQKIRELVEQLRAAQAAVQADDIEARLKAAKDQALRGQRDKAELFEGDGTIVRLGKHKFSVNRQELSVTVIPREDDLYLHLTGTDYFEALANPDLLSAKPYWQMTIASENDQVYRAEFLTYLCWQQIQHGEGGFAGKSAEQWLQDEKALSSAVSREAGARYQEGYEKGIHDHDAMKLLVALLKLEQEADLLRYPGRVRSLAVMYWANHQSAALCQRYRIQARAEHDRRKAFTRGGVSEVLLESVASELQQFAQATLLNYSPRECGQAADYLVAELGQEELSFIQSQDAAQLVELFTDFLKARNLWSRYQSTLGELKGLPGERWRLTEAWLTDFMAQLVSEGQENSDALQRALQEAISLLNGDNRVSRRPRIAPLALQVEGLLGNHRRLEAQTLTLQLDEFLDRLDRHSREIIPAWKQYLDLKQAAVNTARERLRISEFIPRPLTSFVRNKLINDCYLPLIGDNLAKQMGTVGENKRTDLMGLLMMISPPGYGKTTLMEYVASRLGLIFMKINCPSLGHDVISLDPAQAPHATARQELQKLNLALEMGNNVMLYLDDIQHTHPEFLQKFISLCDGTRRIEGVWQDKTKTYDFRGKKMCVVMSGNPYTESGEAFKVPDMLANRADIYNLGDILGGMEEAFELSYLENSMTSNAVLAPLATRSQQDFYRFVNMAKGKPVNTSDFEQDYNAAETREITETLKRMLRVQQVVLAVNQGYIASSAQADQYRTEPPFKLQGSYRNMNKLTEKVSAVMTDAELEQLIDDHYLGESQLLTQGAEENLLKLKEMRGVLTETESARWQTIKADFRKNLQAGGADQDTGQKVVRQLINIADALQHQVQQQKLLQEQESQGQSGQAGDVAQATTDSQLEIQQGYIDALQTLVKRMESLTAAAPEVNVTVDQPPQQELEKTMAAIAKTFNESLVPLVQLMNGKMDLDLKTHKTMAKVLETLGDFKGNG